MRFRIEIHPLEHGISAIDIFCNEGDKKPAFKLRPEKGALSPAEVMQGLKEMMIDEND